MPITKSASRATGIVSVVEVATADAGATNVGGADPRTTAEAANEIAAIAARRRAGRNRSMEKNRCVEKAVESGAMLWKRRGIRVAMTAPISAPIARMNKGDVELRRVRASRLWRVR